MRAHDSFCCPSRKCACNEIVVEPPPMRKTKAVHSAVGGYWFLYGEIRRKSIRVEAVLYFVPYMFLYGGIRIKLDFTFYLLMESNDFFNC